MITKILKTSFSIALRTNTVPQKELLPVKELRNMTKRIQMELLIQNEIPDLMDRMDQLPLFRTAVEFNHHLTNGGLQFQEFPLVKLLHIGLRFIKDQQYSTTIWQNYQQIIRKRLHRCTTEQNMRLLYIMLKIWPHYQFNFDFVSSICLALKKQLPIMNDNQLKILFRITVSRTQNKYESKILLNLQNYILKRVIQKWQNRISNIKARALQLDNLYVWISLSVSTSLRNNLQLFFIEQKAVRLVQIFTKVYEKGIINEATVRHPKQENIQIALNFLSIFQSTHQLFVNDSWRKFDYQWKDQFPKLKQTLLIHGNKGIESLLRKTRSSTVLRHILSLIECKILQKMLQQPNQVQTVQRSQNIKFPRIGDIFQRVMRQKYSSQFEIVHRLTLLSTVVQQQLLTIQQFKLYYDSLPLKQIQQPNLSIIFALLQIQLTLYALSSQFTPNQEAQRLILNFLMHNQCNLRNIDWLAFNYLRIISNSESSYLLPVDNMLEIRSSKDDQTVVRLMNKLITQIEQCDSHRVIEEEQRSHNINPYILELKQFFAQMKLYQVQSLEPIIPHFNRIPHFSNQNNKLAINGFTASKINSAPVLLQKRLLNDLGWTVINLQMPDFLQKTLSQKAQHLQQYLLVEKQRMSLSEGRLIE